MRLADADNAGKGIGFVRLKRAIERSWAPDTSFGGKRWSRRNPAYGHCAVTALVVNDFFGGSFMKTVATGGETVSHFFNKLPGGRIVDLTKKQFPRGTRFSAPERRSRARVLSNPRTAAQYRVFRARVLSALRKSGSARRT